MSATTEDDGLEEDVEALFSGLNDVRGEIECRELIKGFRAATHSQLIKAFAKGCAEIIEASARANSGSGPKDKDGI